MAHKLYENFVLENRVNELLNTKLGVRALMTVDTSLAENAGVIKKINKYSYAGEVEQLEMGKGSTKEGMVTFEQVPYEVDLFVHKFAYFDEQAMIDPKVVEIGLDGASTVMTNDMNVKYFAELAKATLAHNYTGALSYDVVVDAIEKLNTEDEAGLFLVINPSLKAELRKDPDFKAAQLGEILYSGMIGQICGVPVIVSKLADGAYLATKEAVTLFTKKDSEVEQDRDADLRKNSIYVRKVNLVALTDATKVVKLVKGATRVAAK